MASPQLEHGFTRIANELLEAFARSDISGCERRVLDVVIRETYGRKMSPKTAPLAIASLCRSTGLADRDVRRIVRGLIERAILLEERAADFNTPRSLGLNKDHEAWLPPGTEPRGAPGKEPRTGDVAPDRVSPERGYSPGGTHARAESAAASAPPRGRHTGPGTEPRGAPGKEPRGDDERLVLDTKDGGQRARARGLGGPAPEPPAAAAAASSAPRPGATLAAAFPRFARHKKLAEAEQQLADRYPGVPLPEACAAWAQYCDSTATQSLVGFAAAAVKGGITIPALDARLERAAEVSERGAAPAVADAGEQHRRRRRSEPTPLADALPSAAPALGPEPITDEERAAFAAVKAKLRGVGARAPP